MLCICKGTRVCVYLRACGFECVFACSCAGLGLSTRLVCLFIYICLFIYMHVYAGKFVWQCTCVGGKKASWEMRITL